jgi:hypothetical protein
MQIAPVTQQLSPQDCAAEQQASWMQLSVGAQQTPLQRAVVQPPSPVEAVLPPHPASQSTPPIARTTLILGMRAF